MRFCLCCFFPWLLLPHAGSTPATWIGLWIVVTLLMQWVSSSCITSYCNRGKAWSLFLSLNCCEGRSKSVTSPCFNMVPRCKINEVLGYAQFLLVGGKYETGVLAWGSVLSAESVLGSVIHAAFIKPEGGVGRVSECPWTKETSYPAWSEVLTWARSSEEDLSLPSCCRNSWKSWWLIRPQNVVCGFSVKKEVV